MLPQYANYTIKKWIWNLKSLCYTYLGKYSTAGSGNCTECTGGYDCSSPGSTPTQCPAGQFSPQGVASCSACENGKELQLIVMPV